MKLGEFLQKYTEENAIIDLKPSQPNTMGNLPIQIVFGKTIIPIQVAKENVKVLDQKGETYSVKLSEEAIKQIQNVIIKEKGDSVQFRSKAEAMKSFIGKEIKVYRDTAEIYINGHTGEIRFR